MTEGETIAQPLKDGNMLDQIQKAKRQSESFQAVVLKSKSRISSPVEFYFADVNLPYDKQVH